MQNEKPAMFSFDLIWAEQPILNDIKVFKTWKLVGENTDQSDQGHKI